MVAAPATGRQADSRRSPRRHAHARPSRRCRLRRRPHTPRVRSRACSPPPCARHD